MTDKKANNNKKKREKFTQSAIPLISTCILTPSFFVNSLRFHSKLIKHLFHSMIFMRSIQFFSLVQYSYFVYWRIHLWFLSFLCMMIFGFTHFNPLKYVRNCWLVFSFVFISYDFLHSDTYTTKKSPCMLA